MLDANKCGPVTVPQGMEPDRFDRILAALLGISRGQARRSIAAGGAYYNDRRCKVSSRRCGPGDQVACFLHDVPPPPGPPVEEPRILWNDGQLAILDKPPGMPTAATRDSDRGTLEAWARSTLGKVHLPQRLDRRASGLLLVVLDASLNVHVARQLQERQIVREYRVGVDREPEAEQGRLDSTVDGKPAALQYRRSEPGCLRVRLETGRTHQIRIQLAEIGCPVTGDTRYGGSRGALRLRAVRLAFKHPVSEKSIDVKAPDSWYAEPAETLIEEPSTDTTQ